MLLKRKQTRKDNYLTKKLKSLNKKKSLLKNQN